MGEGYYVVDFFNTGDIDIEKISRCILYSEIKNHESYNEEDCKNNELDTYLTEFFQRDFREKENGEEDDFIQATKEIANRIHFVNIISNLCKYNECLVSEYNKVKCEQFYNKMDGSKGEVNKGTKNRIKTYISEYMKEFMLILNATKYKNVFLQARKEKITNQFRDDVKKNVKLSKKEINVLDEIYNIIDFSIRKKQFLKKIEYEKYLEFVEECITEYVFRFSDKGKRNMTEKEIICVFMLEDFFGFYYFKKISEAINDCVEKYGLDPIESIGVLQKILYAIFVRFNSVLRVDFAKYIIDEYFTLLNWAEKEVIKVDWRKWSTKVWEIVESGVEFCKQWESYQLNAEDNEKFKEHVNGPDLFVNNVPMFEFYKKQKDGKRIYEKKNSIQWKIKEIYKDVSKYWHWEMIKGWIEYYWDYDFYNDLDYQNNNWPFEPELDEPEYEEYKKDYN